MILKNKYVIGCHIMFYEIEIYKEYIDGLINLLQTVDNKENIIVDLCFNISEKIEKIDTNKISKDELLNKFYSGINKLGKIGIQNLVTKIITPENDFYFHSDYRRDLNYNYCRKVDYVMHGETDSFFPKEAFQAIESLSEAAKNQNIHRHVICFADRKMWDDSWNPLVHPKFINHIFEDGPQSHLNVNQAKSRMSIEDMNVINSEIDEFEFTYITYPKIDGSCLVLSSDLIQFGVNVPQCLIYNDDHGVSIMIEKLCKDNFVQFICKNLLKVHARRHPNKRLYILNENNPYSLGSKIDTFEKFRELSHENINILIQNLPKKLYTVDDYNKIINNLNKKNNE